MSSMSAATWNFFLRHQRKHSKPIDKNRAVGAHRSVLRVLWPRIAGLPRQHCDSQLLYDDPDDPLDRRFYAAEPRRIVVARRGGGRQGKTDDKQRDDRR